MRIIGKGHSAAKKLCSAINIDVPSKRAFGFLEKKLDFAASNVACNTMKETALEIRSNKTNADFSQCGVSVDGTWQRRGYFSLNRCVSVFSIDFGKQNECVGHIQKCVRTKLRKLKSKRKDLEGRGNLTDAFIDKSQNYYGIAIRNNVNDLQGMQRGVIVAFFHCCSNAKQQMHGEYPVGPDNWCIYQQAVSKDKIYSDKSKGLPPNMINIIKPTYMKLCNQNLLEKCLPGKTQNANECFNGILWKFIPKDVFASLTTG
ncbi:uncharacterized protein TNCV_3604691 [Trichonephila clavipes]|nr:uncharacterized protein TNCV_3604691 [Trichonephila clavipes]